METQIIILEQINPESLPELQGWKEKQITILKENPFVAIVDNTTYEIAKKSRTALKTARTNVEKQDKALASKIAEFRKKVMEIKDNLISITKPHEDKQQTEIDRWEKIKEDEKQEKIRLENERIEKIKNKIDCIYQGEKSKIDKLEFSTIETLKVDWEQNLHKTDITQFEEFELDFNDRVQSLQIFFTEKVKSLQEEENQRLEAERLKKERIEFEQKRKEVEELQRNEEGKLKKERDALDAEKAKLEKQKAEIKAKEDAELKAKQDEENRIQSEKDAKLEAKRLEELKPDKEKAIEYINSILQCQEIKKIVKVEDENIQRELNKIINEISGILNKGIVQIENFK